jgi:hypothetical protein
MILLAAIIAVICRVFVMALMPIDNKRTGTTIKVSDGIRSERAFDLQKGDEGRRGVSHLTSRGETTRRTTVFVLTY